MAVTLSPVNARLQIKVDMGLNEQGKTISKLRTFAHLKPEAPVQDVFDVAQALSSLQQRSVLMVVRSREDELRSS